MKTTLLLIFVALFSYFVSAQKGDINPLDTMSYNSSINAVSDTLV